MGSWRGGWGFTWDPRVGFHMGSWRGGWGVLAGRVGFHMGSWQAGGGVEFHMGSLLGRVGFQVKLSPLCWLAALRGVGGAFGAERLLAG